MLSTWFLGKDNCSDNGKAHYREKAKDNCTDNRKAKDYCTDDGKAHNVVTLLCLEIVANLVGVKFLQSGENDGNFLPKFDRFSSI